MVSVCASGSPRDMQRADRDGCLQRGVQDDSRRIDLGVQAPAPGRGRERERALVAGVRLWSSATAAEGQREVGGMMQRCTCITRVGSHSETRWKNRTLRHR